MSDDYYIALERIKEAAKTGATTLALYFLKFPSLPPEIGQLASLIELNLGDNALVILPPEIGKLASLKTLTLCLHMEINPDRQDWGNNLTSLPVEIGLLTNLTKLDLYDNKLTSLPTTLRNLKALKYLDLRGNYLPIPHEILEKVNEPHVILNYLSWVWDGKCKPLAETKMLVVGQGNVGKTSLIRRLTKNQFSRHENKTEGIAIERWQVENQQSGENQPQTLHVNTWDFGGQEIMHATHQFFLTHRSLYILVLDARQTAEENRIVLA